MGSLRVTEKKRGNIRTREEEGEKSQGPSIKESSWGGNGIIREKGGNKPMFKKRINRTSLTTHFAT